MAMSLHFLEENYRMTKVQRPLTFTSSRKLTFFVDGDVKDLPMGFPCISLPHLKDFQLPGGIDCYKMTVVVDPKVSQNNATSPVIENGVDRNENMKDILLRYKGNKRATPVPHYDDPPFALKRCGRFYRCIIMYHQGKDPILFIGMDYQPEDLNGNFWSKAITLKNRIHLPKAAVPVIRRNVATEESYFFNRSRLPH